MGQEVMRLMGGRETEYRSGQVLVCHCAGAYLLDGARLPYSTPESLRSRVESIEKDPMSRALIHSHRMCLELK